MIVDGGSENKAEVVKLVKAIGIKRVTISVFHPKLNVIIERGYQTIKDRLSKAYANKVGEWMKHLYFVLQADKITIQ